MKLLVFIAVSGLCLVFFTQLSTTMLASEAEVHETVIFRFSSLEKKITDQRFTWIKANREFIYDGLLYDVSTIVYGDDEVLVTCHADIRETKLIAKSKLQQDHQKFHVQSKTGGYAAVLCVASQREVLIRYCTSQSDFEQVAFCFTSELIGRSDPPPEKLG